MKLEVGAIGRWSRYVQEQYGSVREYVLILEIPAGVPLPDEYGCLTIHRTDNRMITVWNLTTRQVLKLSVLELHRHALDVEPPEAPI